MVRANKRAQAVTGARAADVGTESRAAGSQAHEFQGRQKAPWSRTGAIRRGAAPARAAAEACGGETEGRHRARRIRARARPQLAACGSCWVWCVALWRLFWGIGWRARPGVGLVLLAIVWLTSMRSCPTLDELVDARTRGSVTLLDRDGEVFAWRGETFGGTITADTVSPYLQERGRRDRGQAVLPAFRHQPARHRQRGPDQPVGRARAAVGQRRIDDHPAGGETSVPRRAL